MREKINTLKNLLEQATTTINSLVVTINAEIKTQLCTIRQAKAELQNANDNLELISEIVGDTADNLQDIAVGTMGFVEKVDDYLGALDTHEIEENELLNLVEPDEKDDYTELIEE